MNCPICNKQKIGNIKTNSWFPFCSQTCKLADLYNWFSGEYSVDDVKDDPVTIEDTESDKPEPFWKN